MPSSKDDKVKAAIERSKKRVGVLVALFLTGSLSFSEFQNQLEAEIRAGHRAMFEVAYGGKIPPAGLEKLAHITKSQLEFLGAFLAGVAAGTVKKDEALGARASLYVAAMWPSYQTAQRGNASLEGYTEEANVLGEAQHCDECLNETARGFVPIGSLSDIGARTCMVNDSCSLIFR